MVHWQESPSLHDLDFVETTMSWHVTYRILSLNMYCQYGLSVLIHVHCYFSVYDFWTSDLFQDRIVKMRAQVKWVPLEQDKIGIWVCSSLTVQISSENSIRSTIRPNMHHTPPNTHPAQQAQASPNVQHSNASPTLTTRAVRRNRWTTSWTPRRSTAHADSGAALFAKRIAPGAV